MTALSGGPLTTGKSGLSGSPSVSTVMSSGFTSRALRARQMIDTSLRGPSRLWMPEALLYWATPMSSAKVRACATPETASIAAAATTAVNHFIAIIPS